MIFPRECDAIVANRVLRRLAGAPRNRGVALVYPGPIKAAPTMWGDSVARAMRAARRNGYARHLWAAIVRPDVYDVAKFYAALGRGYGTAIRRYDRGQSRLSGTWAERAVARDLAEYTTPTALREPA